MSALHSSFLRSKVISRQTAMPQRCRAGRTGSLSSTIPTSGSAVAAPPVTKDWNLVQRAIAGDFLASEELFATHATRLYRIAFSVLHNKEDAEDAVQNSLCNALINLRSFRGRSSFSTWLTRIVINSALMILRKNRNARELSIDAQDEIDKVSSVHEIPDASPDPEQRFVQYERKAILDHAICNLRPGIRAVVEFGPLRELSLKETAQGLGISLEAAKGRLFHARIALRESAEIRTIAKATTESAEVRRSKAGGDRWK